MDVRKELSEHYLCNLAENLQNSTFKPSAKDVRDYLNYLNDLDVEEIRNKVGEILMDADNELLTSAFAEWVTEENEVGYSIFSLEDELDVVFFGVAYATDCVRGVEELITASRLNRFSTKDEYFEFVDADFGKVHSFTYLFEDSMNFNRFFRDYIDYLIVSRDIECLDADTNIKLDNLFSSLGI